MVRDVTWVLIIFYFAKCCVFYCWRRAQCAWKLYLFCFIIFVSNYAHLRARRCWGKCCCLLYYLPFQVFLIILLINPCAIATKSRGRLKWLLPDGSQGTLWLTKRYPSTLISVFLTGFHYFSYQVATQLSSQDWVNPIPDPIPSEKFLDYSQESNLGPLGWQSDVLATIWNRHSKE